MQNNIFLTFLKLIKLSFVFIVAINACLFNNIEIMHDIYVSRETVEASLLLDQKENIVSSRRLPDFKELINGFFGKDKNKIKDNRRIMVYPGGFPLGFTMECDGVLVITIGSVLTSLGTEKPLQDVNIKAGDILFSLDGVVIKSSEHLLSLLNQEGRDDGFRVNLEIHRGDQIINEVAYPKKELNSGLNRLGLWVRDNAAGVGTLTYVREDNLRFGALGHPVCDIDTGKIMPISKGQIYKCNIVGYNKGMRGNPGELRGLFLRNGLTAGTLDNNNNFGVYGVVEKDYINNINRTPVPVGFRDTVKTGKATILTTIDGNAPKEYDIEIIKVAYQTKSDKKSMVIKVTDPDLIAQTGGIVQGMSGSPIMQNGKLVGAVTHVFVSDPTKGFGVYIDWMIDN